jgi:hypothetical protein
MFDQQLYDETMADLKADFGKAKILTTAEITPYIRKSPQAQYKMRKRGTFGLKQQKKGGLFYVSPSELARWIASDDDTPDDDYVPPVRKVATNPKSKNITGRGPILGRMIKCFETNLENLQDKLDFARELNIKLQAIVLNKKTPPDLIKGQPRRPI